MPWAIQNPAYRPSDTRKGARRENRRAPANLLGLHARFPDDRHPLIDFGFERARNTSGRARSGATVSAPDRASRSFTSGSSNDFCSAAESFSTTPVGVPLGAYIAYQTTI